MDVRQATTDDIDGIRTVARASLEASYDFLDSDVIEDAIGQWYDDDALEQSVAGSDDVLLVGTVDGEVVAFSQSAALGEDRGVGEVRWLHVHPDHRGHGIGDELLDRTREMLRGQGVGRVRGVVLAGNEAGASFYDRHDFERRDDRTIEIAGEEYDELVYETGVTEDAPGPSADIERRDIDGDTRYVFRDEGERGSEGPFHPVYDDRDREQLYTWLCGVCGSADNAMDAMGRLECNECGNVLKPTRWDAAYL